MSLQIIFIILIIPIETKIIGTKVILDTPDFVIEQFEVGKKFKRELRKESSINDGKDIYLLILFDN